MEDTGLVLPRNPVQAVGPVDLKYEEVNGVT